jgi:hypothetical protein
MQWWFAHQPSSRGCIFDNVYLLENSQNKVFEKQHYVCQHFGDPILVDAANLGSYCHQPRWIWTTFASLAILVVAFSTMPPSFDHKVDDILYPNRTSLSIVRDD